MSISKTIMVSMRSPFLTSAELDPALIYNAGGTRGECALIKCLKDMRSVLEHGQLLSMLSINVSISHRGHHLPIEELVD